MPPPKKLADIDFIPDLNTFISKRSNSFMTVFTGPNNSGKSLTLKYMKAAYGRSCYLIGVNRFYHIYHLSVGLYDPEEQQMNWDKQFREQFDREDFNFEQNYFQLNQIFTALTDTQMNNLFEICGELLGCKFRLKKVDANRELSPRYIDMDGQNVSVGSTGTRLLLTLIGICLDTQFNAILIDEPELGLSPKIQSIVSTFLQNPENRDKYFPHLKNIVIATHSHLFLDRHDITNNFTVTRNEDKIILNQVSNMSELYEVQFNLLGNALENLFFPAAIIISEGITDLKYLQRIIEMKFSGKRIVVLSSEGDLKRKIHQLYEIFGRIDSSPYANRIFVVTDSIHQNSLGPDMRKNGINPDSNLIVWDKNGIEFVYPEAVLSGIFKCSAENSYSFTIEDGDRISLNGIVKTKNELNELVLQQLKHDTELPKELTEKLIQPLSKAIGI